MIAALMAGYPVALTLAGVSLAFAVIGDLTGAIEGTIAMRRGRSASCGALDPPSALVYIEQVQVGRPLPFDTKPSSVGGVVAKRGCALVPTLQIVTPQPAAIAIHGDRDSTRLRVTSPGNQRAFAMLEEGGRVTLALVPGITRVEADDGSLAAAWIVATDAPYYALTDERGRYRLDELAPGTYRVTIVQAPDRGEAPIVVHRTVTVTATRTARLDVVH